MDLLERSSDTVHRTFLDAKGTPYAFIGNFISQQALTHASRAFFIDDMGNVFIPEILQSRKDRIGGTLSEPAKSSILDNMAKFLHLSKSSNVPVPSVILVKISCRRLV